MPPVPQERLAASHHQFVSHPAVVDVLGTPVHRLLTGGNRLRSTKNFKNSEWSGPLPPGAVVQSELGFEVASPAFTLLTLANQVPYETLVMCAYELCGSFAVFGPTDRIEAALANPANKAALKLPGAWERVSNSTDLWRRRPLLGVDELRDFARQTDGMRGHYALWRASKAVLGPAASPFEVQAAMLLGLNRKLGGQGLESLRVNERIWLSAVARGVAGKDYCLADLYLQGRNGAILDIECQSHMIHDSRSASLNDSDRSLALQMMGVTVLPMTYEQINDPKLFAQLIEHICKLIDKQPIKANDEDERRRARLRARIMCDWNRLVA